MSAVLKTEAEREREERARIDRLNELRRAHAERTGKHPADVRAADILAKLDEPEEPEISPGREGSKSSQILDFCRANSQAGIVSRAALFAQFKADGYAEKKRIIGLVDALRKQGRFPWRLDDTGKERKAPTPKAARAPESFPAPRKAIGVGLPPPRTTTPSPAPAAPAPAPAESDLAAVLARIDRLFDDLTDSERTVAARYIAARFC